MQMIGYMYIFFFLERESITFKYSQSGFNIKRLGKSRNPGALLEPPTSRVGNSTRAIRILIDLISPVPSTHTNVK